MYGWIISLQHCSQVHLSFECFPRFLISIRCLELCCQSQSLICIFWFSYRLKGSFLQPRASLFPFLTSNPITQGHFSFSLVCKNELSQLADSNSSKGKKSQQGSKSSSSTLLLIMILMFSRHTFAISMAFSVSFKCFYSL